MIDRRMRAICSAVLVFSALVPMVYLSVDLFIIWPLSVAEPLWIAFEMFSRKTLLFAGLGAVIWWGGTAALTAGSIHALGPRGQSRFNARFSFWKVARGVLLTLSFVCFGGVIISEFLRHQISIHEPDSEATWGPFVPTLIAGLLAGGLSLVLIALGALTPRTDLASQNNGK